MHRNGTRGSDARSLGRGGDSTFVNELCGQRVVRGTSTPTSWKRVRQRVPFSWLWYSHGYGTHRIDPAGVADGDTGGVLAPGQTLPPPPKVTLDTLDDFAMAAPGAPPGYVAPPEVKTKAVQVASNVDKVALVLRESAGVSSTDVLFIKSFTLESALLVKTEYAGRRLLMMRRSLGEGSFGESPVATGGSLVAENTRPALYPTAILARGLEGDSTDLEFDFQIKIRGSDAGAKATQLQSFLDGSSSNSNSSSTASFGAAFTQSLAKQFDLPESVVLSQPTVTASVKTVIAIKNSWTYKEWSVCSTVCGEGQKIRGYFCQKMPNSFDDQCDAAQEQALELSQACTVWDGCEFQLSCPLGPRHGCTSQRLVMMVVWISLSALFGWWFFKNCRKPKEGGMRLNLEGLDTMLEGEVEKGGSSGGMAAITWSKAVDPETGKGKVIWNVDALKLPTIAEGQPLEGVEQVRI